MRWTILKEDFQGNIEGKIEEEFYISKIEILYNSNFRVLKYLDPYDDITFSFLMIADLIQDLSELKKLKSENAEIIAKIIQLAETCKNGGHSYIKFCGD